MKTILLRSLFISLLLITFALSSCHPTHFVVGKGEQQHQVVKSRNKFLLLGLVHIGTAPDAAIMSKNSNDYKITVKLTFADVFLNVITLGVYSPITVEVAY